MGGRRVLFVCDTDSQIYGALPSARVFEQRGWRVQFAFHLRAAIPMAALQAADGFEIL